MNDEALRRIAFLENQVNQLIEAATEVSKLLGLLGEQTGDLAQLARIHNARITQLEES